MKTATIDELKDRILAKSTKISTENRTIQTFRIFDFDQKKIYAEFNGGGVRFNDVPDEEERVKSFSVIFGVLKRGITEKQNG